jgi:hypothetical protein
MCSCFRVDKRRVRLALCRGLGGSFSTAALPVRLLNVEGIGLDLLLVGDDAAPPVELST